MKNRNWRHEQVVYQIYPRSFCDSNGDGIGDIQGVISKLDYLHDLGIGILWLSPLYCSPNDDFGYDISDYCDINPEYGTIEDFRQLTAEAQKRGIRIIMDLVINHTSDAHYWFSESRKSTDNPYRDYYYWRKTPNNWTSFFGGSAWKRDQTTGEYFLHLFSKKMPDLNYYNPKVLDEVKKILDFWFNLGISGFRCDVINVIYKTSRDGFALCDGKKRFTLTGQEFYLTQDGCLDILQKLRREIFSKHDCFTVGETVMVTPSDAQKLTDPERGALDMVFSFEHMECNCISNKWFRLKFSPVQFKKILYKWQKGLNWNANYFENHDQIRSVSRFGNTKTYWKESAKMLATLLFTLRGTPYVFQGQELGMTNAPFKSLSQLRDSESHSIDKTAREMRLPAWLRKFIILRTTRDHARTPMHWNTQKYAGFTNAKISDCCEPWLAVNPNYERINAQNQLEDTASILHFYRNLVGLRKTRECLMDGDFTPLKTSGSLYAYERRSQNETALILLNFCAKAQKIPTTLRTKLACGKLLVTNYERTDVAHLTQIAPYEALVLLQIKIHQEKQD